MSHLCRINIEIDDVGIAKEGVGETFESFFGRLRSIVSLSNPPCSLTATVSFSKNIPPPISFKSGSVEDVISWLRPDVV